jgi:hypothetical protein
MRGGRTWDAAVPRGLAVPVVQAERGADSTAAILPDAGIPVRGIRDGGMSARGTPDAAPAVEPARARAQARVPTDHLIPAEPIGAHRHPAVAVPLAGARSAARAAGDPPHARQASAARPADRARALRAAAGAADRAAEVVEAGAVAEAGADAATSTSNPISPPWTPS